ncbi:MAG: hypothetical protein ACTS78_02590 [Arsenophonus sp. NC-WZS1-MAG3]
MQYNIEQGKMVAVQEKFILDKESAYFMEWLHSQPSINIIRDYRS